ncbi:MAG: hypothetical protein JST54_25750 [Deltaproteobacteria bacterium]|nr:hypothetical protein [Deltaproteobacteria bacterium]
MALVIPGSAFAGKSKGKTAEKAKHGGSSSSASSSKGASKGGSSSAKPVAGALSEDDRPAASSAPAAGGGGAPHGPQRIDFDDRVIEGQSNKSGAVYLYDRKDLQVESMVKQPSTFRAEIAKGLFE